MSEGAINVVTLPVYRIQVDQWLLIEKERQKSHYIYTSQNHKDKHLDGKKMENDKVSISTEWFDLVVRGVLVPSLGCLGILFNFMIIIVLRRPEFTKVSINLIMLCKFTQTMFF